MKLTVKDLITIGLFTAIYFVVFFAVGMIGFIPYLMLALPFLIAVIGGIPILSMVTKVGKFGAYTVSGILVSFLMFVTGHAWTVVLTGVVTSVLADVIVSKGGFKNWSALISSYCVYCLWVVGNMFPLFFMKEAYFKQMAEGYGTEYAQIMEAIFPLWMLPVMAVTAIVGGIIGAYLGRSVMKRHFLRAGII